MQKKQPKFVVIGGGTGSFTLLSGLKTHVRGLTALVNMSDDGGSTGILRDELGVLPPGDVRQCLVALSDSSKLRDLFNYRLDQGSLKGHSFGNLFLSTVEKMTDSFEEAVRLASEVLHITGRVLPITTVKSDLVLTNDKGDVTKGEARIGHMDFGGAHRPVISLDPAGKITPHAKKSILEADVVIIAPGNLYGSLAPALVVDGVGAALRQTKAKVAYACNLVTKPKQTDGFFVHDYADEIERFAGAGPILDYVFFNSDEPTETMLQSYTHDGEFLVEFDLEVMADKHYAAIGLPLIDTSPIASNKNDAIAHKRSLIRHDSEELARKLMEIYTS